jgi:ABC-type branched-subunit amino acid transport system substrate-binding protein
MDVMSLFRSENSLNLVSYSLRTPLNTKNVCVLCSFVGALLCFSSTPALSSDAILVAQTFDLSGASNIGKDFSSGIRTYIDAVNQRGGVRGKK